MILILSIAGTRSLALFSRQQPIRVHLNRYLVTCSNFY